MAKREPGEGFSYTVDESCDEIFDERGNTVLAMRKVQWGSAKEPKLELRKWYVDVEKETASKGFSFLTEEGPHNLIKVMLEKNYGHTEEVIEAIKDRDDFIPALNSVLKNKEVLKDLGVASEIVEDNYYDPKECLLQ